MVASNSFSFLILSNSRILIEYENNVLNQSSKSVVDKAPTDIQSYFLTLAETILVRLNAEFMAGASMARFKNDTIVAWFNGQPHHTAPLAMNLAHNAIVRAMLGSDHSIRVANEPLPFTTGSRIEMLSTGSNMGFQLATNIGFAMAFVSAFYVIFYIKVSSWLIASSCQLRKHKQFNRN